MGIITEEVGTTIKGTMDSDIYPAMQDNEPPPILDEHTTEVIAMEWYRYKGEWFKLYTISHQGKETQFARNA